MRSLEQGCSEKRKGLEQNLRNIVIMEEELASETEEWQGTAGSGRSVSKQQGRVCREARSGEE